MKKNPLFPLVTNRFICLLDLDNPAVDLIWTCQTSKPPGGAEGGGGCSTRWKQGRHAADVETHSTGQRSFEGNAEVRKMKVCFTCLNLSFKRTLSTPRLHPVAVSLQRYIAQDIIIQNYHIPTGVSPESKSRSSEVSNLAITSRRFWHCISFLDPGPVRSVRDGQRP